MGDRLTPLRNVPEIKCANVSEIHHSIFCNAQMMYVRTIWGARGADAKDWLAPTASVVAAAVRAAVRVSKVSGRLYQACLGK